MLLPPYFMKNVFTPTETYHKISDISLYYLMNDLNIKGLIFDTGFVLCGFALGACGTSAEAKQDKPL